MRTRELRTRVRRGARALDSLIPGWFRQNQVRLTTLDLSSPCDCVIGQLGHSRVGAGEFDPHYGFDIDYDIGRNADYDKLTALWGEEIRARRGR